MLPSSDKSVSGDDALASFQGSVRYADSGVWCHLEEV